MKKLIFALFAFIFTLTSCTAANADLLGYQISGAEISGILHTDTGAFRLGVTLFPVTEDELASGVRDAVLTFTYTDGSGTHSATVTDGTVTLSAGGLTIPCSDEAGLHYLHLTSLFAIDSAALYSVEPDDDGTLTASFGEGDSGAVTVTIDPVTSLPKVIAAKNGKYKYEIDEYRLISDDPGADD